MGLTSTNEQNINYLALCVFIALISSLLRCCCLYERMLVCSAVLCEIQYAEQLNKETTEPLGRYSNRIKYELEGKILFLCICVFFVLFFVSKINSHLKADIKALKYNSPSSIFFSNHHVGAP